MKSIEELEALGFGSDIDAFETYVGQLQDAAADGEPMVQDPVYDEYRRLLEKIKPSSPLLKRNWEKDSSEELKDYDELLKQYGMRSIRTCTNRIDLDKYIDCIYNLGGSAEVLASFKLNGHACRIVYEDGKLVSATTRGRYKKGRDITRHLKAILGEYNEFLEGYHLVEIRGELIVTYNDFEKELSKTCKTPLSSVTSLVRDSVSDNELKYLHFVAYKILTQDNEDNGFEFLSDEYDYLNAIGFEIPNYGVYDVSTVEDIEKILSDFEEMKKNREIGFDTDGIVIGINENELFYNQGLDGNHFNANIAVKMGIWECNMYTSTIREIAWERGKKWLTPKAIIEPVITVTGATVKVVPIYNVGVMNKLKLIPGNRIYFRFGGETGVQLLTPDGLSVTAL